MVIIDLALIMRIDLNMVYTNIEQLHLINESNGGTKFSEEFIFERFCSCTLVRKGKILGIFGRRE